MADEVTRPLAVIWISRLMESVLPRELGELVVGDLNEEFALRTRSQPSAGATAWFAMQAAASVPRLLVLSVRRLSWLKSFGVAVVAYLALGLVEPYMHRFMSLIIEPGFRLQLIIDLCIGFTACACGGFLSTWIHRGSAFVYSLIGTGFLASMMMTRVNPDLPSWFLAAFLAVAFVAPIVGGVVFISCANRLAGRGRRQGGGYP
jgi:hypothetical protein